MDPGEFFSTSRLVIVAGKGGVGKTTVSAALARAAARAGRTTLLVEVDGKSGLPAMFGHGELGYEETVLQPPRDPGEAEVRGRAITADAALVEYLEDHGLARISRRLADTGALDVVATAAPGIKDILLLGKVKQLERAGTADLVVLDAPAAGHAITFLQSARGLLDAVRVGPINTQAADVLELLEDHRRCQVLLVTLAEETPVNELVDTAYMLEDRVGVGLGPVVVNGLYPDPGTLDRAPAAAAADAGTHLDPAVEVALAQAATFRQERTALQDAQIERLANQLPLPQLRLPLLFTAELDASGIDQLASSLLEGIRTLETLPS